MRRRVRLGVWLLIPAALGAASSPGDGPVEVRMPLDESGAVDLAGLVAKLGTVAGLEPDRAVPAVKLPVQGLSGAMGRTFLGEALGPDVALTVEPSALVLRIESGGDAGRAGLRTRVLELARQAETEAARASRYGFRGRASYLPADPTRPTVCLVHGMNSSSGSFIHLIPALEAEGFGVVVYDYPFNRDLDESVAAFGRDWAAFRARTGDARPWAVLTHSMGALLARAYVEGPAYRGDVSDLILIAPPNQGSAVAELQGLLQWIEAAQALNGNKPSERRGGLLHVREGLGAAAEDLVPGSRFLVQLNGRPRRQGVRYRILAGNEGFLDEPTRRQIEARMKLVQRSGGLIGGLTRLALGTGVTAALDEVTDGTGDGCVAVASTSLEGTDPPVVIAANHVALIRGPLLYPEPGPIACWPHVREWLAARHP